MTRFERYLRSLNMADLRGVVMVILVVGCGYGQYLRRHQNFKHFNDTRPRRRRRNRILRMLTVKAYGLFENIKSLHFKSSLVPPPP